MKITIDNQLVSIPPGATILDAARAVGVEIPTLCHLRGVEACTSCFVCVVKVAGREALVPACATLAAEGMVVESGSAEVREARRAALELLLSDHAGDCVAPCQTACPAGMDIPRMLRLIVSGRWAEASDVVRARIALPGVLGRVCPAPCEHACRRRKLDGPVTICALKAAVAEKARVEGVPPARPEGVLPSCLAGILPASGDEAGLTSSNVQAHGAPNAGETPATRCSRVAVVGAGPAGLSAAWFLRGRGYGCVVVEAAEAAGGGLRQVEAERLPAAVLAADVAVIQEAGVEFRYGVAVRAAEALSALSAEFDAVLLATGRLSAEAAEALGLEVTPRGVKVDACGRTSRPRVFAAGAVTGLAGRLAVRAGADALTVVEAIDAMLAGREFTPPPRPWTCRLGSPSEAELRELARAASRSTGVPPVSRMGVSPMQPLPLDQTFTSQPNANETATPCVGHGRDARATHGRDAHATAAGRCLHCDCRKAGGGADPAGWPCQLRRWAAVYGATKHGGGSGVAGPRRKIVIDDTHELAIYDSGKCISCGLCVRIAKQRGEEFGLTFIGRGFSVRVGVPLGRSLREGLTKCAEEVAAACPVGAICLKEVTSGK